MIETLLLSLTPLPLAAGPSAPSPPPPLLQDDQGVDHEPAIAQAGEDVAKLLELAEAWAAAEDEDGARAAYKRIIEIDEGHEAAHKALGHHAYGGKWFETYAALSKYRRTEAKEMLEKYGKVRFGDEWVLKDDVPFLRMDWAKAEDGSWLRPGEAERLEEEARLRAGGWQQQELTWIHPDGVCECKWVTKNEQGEEQPPKTCFQMWTAGFVKVGDEWVTEEQANEYHAQLDQWWVVPGERFVALSTCDRRSAYKVAWWADNTYSDLVRIFGMHPSSKPRLLCVNSIPQYNAAAGGDPSTGRQPNEGSGWSSVHYAYFADAWFDPNTSPPSFNGMGVCYWATDDDLEGFGQHAVRHAAAHSFMEAIDPSWDFVSRAVTGGGGQGGTGGFWTEKKIPLWLRYGAASYVERYFKDPSVDEATEDPWWARDWAFENLRTQDGPRPFEEIFAFGLDPNDPVNSSKLISEAGLLVSFIVDGKCGPVIEAHQAFKSALKSGENLDEAIENLQKSIVRNERTFKMYANM